MVKNSSNAFVISTGVAGAFVAFLILLMSTASMPYQELFILQRVPVALVIGAVTGGLLGFAIFLMRSAFKKLELICGAATAAVAVSLSVFVLDFDWHASLQVERQFIISHELFMVLVLFLFPGMLVGVGSYADAVRRWPWGLFALVAGCLAVIASFLFLFVMLPLAFVRLTTWSVLTISFVLLAMMTLMFSFLMRREFTK